MCGRFKLQASPQQIADQYSLPVSAIPADYQPSSKVIPGHRVLAVMPDGKIALRVRWMKWGIIPRTSGPVYATARPLYNARSETVNSRQSFQQAYAARRCVIIADGFFEWLRSDGEEPIPVCFHHQDNRPMALAGIWNPSEHPLGNCVILTTEPNSLVKPVHNRMPVVLDPDQALSWMNLQTKPTTLRDLTRAREWPEMTMHETIAKSNRPQDTNQKPRKP